MALALLTALVACGSSSDDDPAGGTPQPSASGAITSPATAPPATGSPGTPGGTAAPDPQAPDGSAAFSSEPVNVTRTPPGVATLVGLRSAHHVEDGLAFDRLVLEFSGGLPGYSASYTEQVISPGAGSPVALDGQAFLELVVHPAAMHDDSGTTTLRDTRSGGGLPALVEYTIAGDFEGYVHLGIGLDDVVGFRVTELTGPDRIIVDFAA